MIDGETSQAYAATPAGWEGILDPDERILWQGRPDPGFRMDLARVFPAVFGLFFAGFATFWMVMASRAGGIFWMFGLLFFFVGLGMILSSIFGDTIKRRGSWYTLTDRRAFIATDLPFRGKSLKSYPIDRDSVIDYRAGEPATIHFAHEYHRGEDHSYRVSIGFERIAEGEAVMRLIREVQRGAASGSPER